MTGHLRYEKHDPVGRDGATPATAPGSRLCRPRSGLSRSRCPGTGTFALQVVGKRQRGLDGIGQIGCCAPTDNRKHRKRTGGLIARHWRKPWPG